MPSEPHNCKVDEDLSQSISSDLRSGESVIWAGRPGGRLVSSRDAYIIPFSLLWCGFAIFWETAALSSGAGPFPVFGIPFVLIGLYFVVGRFIVKARLRRQTIYAVTNERVLVKQGETLRSMPLDGLPSVDVTSRGGRGDIFFGPVDYRTAQIMDTGMDFMMRGRNTGPLAFLGIEDPDGVSKTIESARASMGDHGKSAFSSSRGEF